MPLKRGRPLKRKSFKASSRTKERKAIEMRLDALCRDLVALRDYFVCVRCSKPCTHYEINKAGFRSYPGFDWSHVIGRSRKSMRWLVENAMFQCSGCHFKWHSGRTMAQEHEWFMVTYPDRWVRLKLQSQIRPRDRKPLDLKLIELDLLDQAKKAGLGPVLEAVG